MWITLVGVVFWIELVGGIILSLIISVINKSLFSGILFLLINIISVCALGAILNLAETIEAMQKKIYMLEGMLDSRTSSSGASNARSNLLGSTVSNSNSSLLSSTTGNEKDSLLGARAAAYQRGKWNCRYCNKDSSNTSEFCEHCGERKQ